MNLGLEHGVNRLVPYSDDWVAQYAAESTEIRAACGDHIQGIEHVGSTAIPNMPAKAIVDIVAGVAALADAQGMIPGMKSLGYDYPGDIGIPDHRIFGRDPGFRKYLIHVVELNSARWNDYINFRDALREDPKLAQEYFELKTTIIEKHPQGRAQYAELKSEFVLRVLQR